MTGTNGHRFSAGVKSRSEGRSVIKPPLLAIAACYTALGIKLRETRRFICRLKSHWEVVQLIHRPAIRVYSDSGYRIFTVMVSITLAKDIE